MTPFRFIKNKTDANNIWQRRSYYRLDQFLTIDLIRIFLYLNPRTNLTSRKNHYKDFLSNFGGTPVGKLTSSSINSWFQKIKNDQRLTDRTLAQIKSQLNNFFKWLTFEEIIKFNPLLKIKIKRNVLGNTNRTILTESELLDILTMAKKYDSTTFYPYLYTLIHTGARRSEIMKLKWSDIDLQTSCLFLRDTKNGDSRTIKMSLGLAKLIANIKHSSDYIFPNPSGKELGRAKVQRLMRSFFDSYPQSRDWRYHDLRHSFAYNFLRKGGEMYQLQAILGHKTIQLTVDLYGNLKSQDIEKPSPYSF